jgi:hypothetical protein
MKDGISKVFEALMDAEITTNKKMKIVSILMNADQGSTQTDLEPTFSVTPEEMPTVTVKQKHNLGWTQVERIRLFARMVEIWGPFIEWQGAVTPGTSTFKGDLVMLGREFGRSAGGIKAQMLASISDNHSLKNTVSGNKIREAATNAGFIE